MDRTSPESCAAPSGHRPKPRGHELAAGVPRPPIRRHRINGNTASPSKTHCQVENMPVRDRLQAAPLDGAAAGPAGNLLASSVPAAKKIVGRGPRDECASQLTGKEPAADLHEPRRYLPSPMHRITQMEHPPSPRMTT